MNSMRRLQLIALAAFGCAIASHARAVVLVNDARLVSASPGLAQASKSATVTIVNAGTYRLAVADDALSTPSALTSVSVVVTQGSTIVAQAKLDQTSSSVPTQDFTAQPGDYQLFAIGKASGVAKANITVVPVSGGTSPYHDSLDLLPPTQPSSNTTEVETSIHVYAAGTYTLTLTDQAFPAALQDYQLILFDRTTQASWQLCLQPTPTCQPSNTLQFTASGAGDFDLGIEAVAGGAAQAGLLSLTVTSSGLPAVTNGATTYAVGKMPPPAQFSLPAGGADSLVFTDLAFPSPTALTGMRAVLVQNDTVIARATQLGSTPITNAQQGNVQLYAFPGSTGTATYSRQVMQGSQVVYGDVGTSAATSFTFPTTIATLGTYTVQLKDFGFPSQLTNLQAVISQSGTMRATMSAPGSTDVQLNAGPADVLLIPQAAANANSLFGVSISVKGTGAKVLEHTQAIGQLFDARTFTVTDAGSYDVSLADLKFPAAFSELAVAVTRGPTLIGQIFGGGKFSFPATPGDYTLNFIANAGGTPAEYGLYTAIVASTPPPSVTLTASPTTVAAGGTTTLTWNATGADTCTASGAWSGTKATSNHETSSALSADSTFTLTCTGASGSTSASVTVRVPAADSIGGGGGGGSISLELLLLLTGVTAAVRRVKAPQ